MAVSVVSSAGAPHDTIVNRTPTLKSNANSFFMVILRFL